MPPLFPAEETPPPAAEPRGSFEVELRVTESGPSDNQMFEHRSLLLVRVMQNDTPKMRTGCGLFKDKNRTECAVFGLSSNVR